MIAKQEKEAIARVAAAQVEDGDTLILDAGNHDRRISPSTPAVFKTSK